MDLADRLLNFSARVGRVVDELPDGRLSRHIAGQLVRSGTSPAPNYEEACSAESRRDFVHKLSISLKEMRESRSWLRLIAKSGALPLNQLREIIDEADQLCRILAQSIVTAKRNDGKMSETLPPQDELIGQSLAKIEAYYIRRTLESTNGDMCETARILQIEERLLAQKLKEYGFNETDLPDDRVI